MTFAADWSELLTWTVNVSSILGEDGYGNPVWSVPVAVQAHVDAVSSSDPVASGREGVEAVGSTATTLYMPTDLITVRPGDRLVLPDGSVLNAASVVSRYDETGVLHHLEVTLEAS